tara:strand:- start:32089 stop:32370 length:282 start_codon:yes stop_codon:yes gene_type:complete
VNKVSYKNIVATIGKYQSNGETKYVNRNVGKLMETQHGLKITLDASFNPAGCEKGEDGSVWLSLFDPKPKQEVNNNAQQQSNNQGFQDEKIPF